MLDSQSPPGTQTLLSGQRNREGNSRKDSRGRADREERKEHAIDGVFDHMTSSFRIEWICWRNEFASISQSYLALEG